ncbi:MAG: hypothetical protein RIR51_578 [Bacteroidota bacterium]|jgi:endonuclease/exonuclease/phosphatase family metal-dependent hydrolase
MKIIIKISLFLFCIHSLSSQAQFRVMTFNIRMDTPSDGINQWKNRKEHCAELILFHQADIVGAQEAFIHQIQDLKMNLEDYQWIGKGRDDGKEEGEFSPLFYNQTKFELKEFDTFWLSETCEKVSFGWDAACRRVVTWGHFIEKSTGKDFYAFNTHFDHQGEVARRNSASLIIDKIQEIAGDKPAILLGDFNATPDQEPIQIILNSGNPHHLIDAEMISKQGHYGPYSTFTGFVKEQDGRHIDYVFVKNGVEVLQHASHSEQWENRYPSDHFPVSALVEIP